MLMGRVTQFSITSSSSFSPTHGVRRKLAEVKKGKPPGGREYMDCCVLVSSSRAASSFPSSFPWWRNHRELLPAETLQRAIPDRAREGRASPLALGLFEELFGLKN